LTFIISIHHSNKETLCPKEINRVTHRNKSVKRITSKKATKSGAFRKTKPSDGLTQLSIKKTRAEKRAVPDGEKRRTPALLERAATREVLRATNQDRKKDHEKRKKPDGKVDDPNSDTLL
jgi:hypothetical protein